MCADCVVPGVGALRRALAWVRGSLHNRAVVVRMHACARCGADVRGRAVRPRCACCARRRRLVRAPAGLRAVVCMWPGVRVRARCQLAGGVRARSGLHGV